MLHARAPAKNDDRGLVQVRPPAKPRTRTRASRLIPKILGISYAMGVSFRATRSPKLQPKDEKSVAEIDLSSLPHPCMLALVVIKGLHSAMTNVW
jgi:hypothetical protein